MHLQVLLSITGGHICSNNKYHINARLESRTLKTDTENICNTGDKNGVVRHEVEHPTSSLARITTYSGQEPIVHQLRSYRVGGRTHCGVEGGSERQCRVA